MGGDLAEKVCTPCRGGIPPLTRDEANALLKQTPAWTIVDDPMRIERRFAFGNFRDALMFVDRVGAVAEAENHHPDIRFGWGYCCVEIDLRRERIHNNIVLRSKVVASIRRRMTDAGFMEMQTPILTASSPEGARDYLVPSRQQPGTFYALPQAPQQFKQLLMASGFDRYFQIAPCFRDEDARADRS